MRVYRTLLRWLSVAGGAAVLLCGQAGASFYLYLGTYPREKAEAVHAQLAERGYNVYILYGEEYEVRLGGFDTREKAQAMAEKLRADEKLVARVDEEEDLDPEPSGQLPALREQPAEEEDPGREADEESYKAYDDPQAQRIISVALDLFGHPYKYGGTTIGRGIDCSYFSQRIFKEMGVSLPRTAREQFKAGIPVKKGELMTGDLLFFQKTYYTTKKGKKKRPASTRINHVGVYLSNGEFIHATINAKRVTISNLDEPYYTKRFAGARRVLAEAGK